MNIALSVNTGMRRKTIRFHVLIDEMRCFSLILFTMLQLSNISQIAANINSSFIAHLTAN